MSTLYSEQPTILIGLGGISSRIVDKVYGKVQKMNLPTEAFCVDTDPHDMEVLKNIPRSHYINLSARCPIRYMLEVQPEATKWFPQNRLLFSRTMAEGAGRIRAVSRLLYEAALQMGKFEVLYDSLAETSEKCIELGTRMRISIVTSLVGGTGSGIYIQIAMMIRKYMMDHFPEVNVKIQGEFILPENFAFVPSMVEKRDMQSNTYAALKELNAINEYFYHNGAPVELKYSLSTESIYADCLPYDYCFLYDRKITAGFSGMTYIEDALWERLFGDSADRLYRAFIDKIRFSQKKKAGNMYGMICAELISDKLDEYLETGVQLDQIENFRYGKGIYYQSYKEIIENQNLGITPHLDVRWYNTLPDIGEEQKDELIKIPKEGFVFISYSSQEIDIAEQTRLVLEKNGISCWMAPQSIPAGSDYGLEIPKALAKCKALVLLLSKASQESNWVPKEVGIAISKGKIVIPFQIDNSMLTDSFDFMLTNNQRIEAFNRMSEAYRELVKRLLDIMTDVEDK